MQPISINEQIYHILLKHDAPGIGRQHTADVIAQQVEYHIHERKSYDQEKDAWEALSLLCQEAKVSVLVDGDSGFTVMDHDTDRQTQVRTKEDVIQILQAKLDYQNEVSGYNWI